MAQIPRPGLTKHIIWDWNGTLLDDAQVSVDISNSQLAAQGLENISLEHHRSIFTFPIVKYYEILGFDLAKVAIEKLNHEFHAHYDQLLDGLTLHEDADSVLNQLTLGGLEHSVLSAYPEDRLIPLLETYQLTRHFKKIRGGKPGPPHSKIEDGHDLLRELALSAEETVIVGDTVHDAEVAQALGAGCILLAHGHYDAKRLAATGYPVCESLIEIIPLITLKD